LNVAHVVAAVDKGTGVDFGEWPIPDYIQSVWRQHSWE